MSDEINSTAISLFGYLINRQGMSCITIGQALCNRLNVPYLKEREVDSILTDNCPDSYNSIQEAIERLADGVSGIYYHYKTMNLVLVGASGEKVGIRSTALTRSLERLKPLGELKKAHNQKTSWLDKFRSWVRR